MSKVLHPPPPAHPVVHAPASPPPGTPPPGTPTAATVHPALAPPIPPAAVPVSTLTAIAVSGLVAHAPAGPTAGDRLKNELLTLINDPTRPAEFEGFLASKSFVQWVRTAPGLQALHGMSSFTDSNASDAQISAGFEALRALTQHMPPSTLRTEAKIFILIRDTIEGRRQSKAELIALLDGRLIGEFAGELANEQDRDKIARDVSTLIKDSAGPLTGAIERWIASGGVVTQGEIDRLLRDLVRQPIFEPFGAPLSITYDLLTDPHLSALIDFAEAYNLPLDRVLLHDTHTPGPNNNPPAVDPVALGHLVDADLDRLTEADIAGLFAYLKTQVPGHHFTLDPQNASVRTLLQAYAPFRAIDLAQFRSIDIGPDYHLHVGLSAPLLTSLTPTPPILPIPPAGPSAGARTVHDMRLALATLPPAFAGALGNHTFVSALVDDPTILRGLVQLATARPGPGGYQPHALDAAFKALADFGNALPADSPLRPTIALTQRLRLIFGDAGAQDALLPTLGLNQQTLSTLYNGLQDPKIAATVGVTHALGIPVETVLHDLLHGLSTPPVPGELDPELVAKLVDGDMQPADARALFAYLQTKKPEFTLDVEGSAAVRTLLKSYKPFANADLSAIANIHFGPGTQVAVHYTQAALTAFTPTTPSVPITPLPPDAGPGDHTIDELRRALATLAPALLPLRSNADFIDWLAHHPDKLPTIVKMLDAKPTDPGYAATMTAGLSALGELGRLAPPKLKSFIELAQPLDDLFHDQNTQAALRPLLQPNRSALVSLGRAVNDPTLAATLRVAEQIHLPLATVMQDVLVGAPRGLDRAIVGHLIDGKMTTQDMQGLFKYLVLRQPNFTLQLKNADGTPNADVLAILNAYPPFRGADLSGVVSLRFGGPDKAHIDFTPALTALLTPTLPDVTKNETPPPPPPPGTAAGAQTVFQLRQSLDTLPPAFKQLLRDDAIVPPPDGDGKLTFASWLAVHPQVLHDMLALATARPGTPNYPQQMDAAFKALATFGAALPTSSQLKPLLVLAPTLRGALGDEDTQAVLDEVVGPIQSSLQALDTALQNDDIASTLQLANDAGLSLPRLLDDVLHQRLPPEVLARLVDGNPTAGDLAYVIDYLHRASPGGIASTVTMAVKSTELQSFLSLFPLPFAANLAAIDSMSIGPNNDTIHVTFKDTLWSWGPFDLNMTSFDGKLQLQNKNGTGAVVIGVDFGTILHAAFIDLKFAPTGNKVIDTVLDVLFKIIASVFLFLGAVIAAIIGIDLRIADDGKNPKRLDVKSLPAALQKVYSDDATAIEAAYNRAVAQKRAADAARAAAEMARLNHLTAGAVRGQSQIDAAHKANTPVPAHAQELLDALAAFHAAL